MSISRTITTMNRQYRISTLLIVTTVVAANLSVSCMDQELMFLTAVLTTLVGLGALLRIRQSSEPLRGRFGALASTWFWPCMFAVLAGTQSFAAWQRNQ